MTRSLRLSLILSAAALFIAGATSKASAAPITLTLAGQFLYIDFEYLSWPRNSGADLFWAFDDAIRATGAATSTPGTLLMGNVGMSLTLNPDVADADLSSLVGYYPGALTGKLWLGDTAFSITPLDVWTFVDQPCAVGSTALCPGGAFLGFSGITGPSLTAGGYSFTPGHFQFFNQVLFPGTTSDQLPINAFLNATSWGPLQVWFGFNRAAHLLAAQFQVVSVTVPETSAIWVLGAGIITLTVLRLRLHRRR